MPAVPMRRVLLERPSFFVLILSSSLSFLQQVTCMRLVASLAWSTPRGEHSVNPSRGQHKERRISKSVSKLSWLPDWIVTIFSDVLYLYLRGKILGCGNSYSVEIIGSFWFPQRSPDTTNSWLPSGFLTTDLRFITTKLNQTKPPA